MCHRGAFATAALIFAVVAAPGAWADKRGQRCAVTKLQETSRYVGAAFDCRIAAALAGTSADPVCTAGAADRLGAVFAARDARGGCASTDDAGVILTTVDEYVGRITLGVRPPVDPGGACTAARLRIFRDTAREGLACHIGFARRGTFIDFACISAAQAPLFEGLTALDAAGTCSAPIPTVSDVFGNWGGLVGTGQRIPFTRCGNGVVELGEQCDGGPLCGVGCFVDLPVCCDSAIFPGVCTNASPSFCPPEVGVEVHGMACVSSGTPCPPDVSCTGTCQALALPAPVTVCCQESARTCSEAVATDTAALAAALSDCPFDPLAGGANQKLGLRCVRRGRCVPRDR